MKKINRGSDKIVVVSNFEWIMLNYLTDIYYIITHRRFRLPSPPRCLPPDLMSSLHHELIAIVKNAKVLEG